MILIHPFQITIPGLFATLHKELTSQRLRNEFSIMHTVFLVSQASLNHRETLPKIREMYHQLMKVSSCTLNCM